MIDITANKHHNNAASTEAFHRGNPRHTSAREIIYKLIDESSDGMTSKEIAQRTGWAMHTFSGRITELLSSGRIRDTETMRYGARVLVAVHAPQQLELLEAA